MNIVELISGPENQSPSPCRWGNIVEGHACYCHNEAKGMPRKCPIWRHHGISNLSKWKQSPWEKDSYQIRKISYSEVKGKKLRTEISELVPTWPDEGCPGFEPKI